MEANEVLERCQMLGIRVQVAGDKLRLSPPSQVSSDLLEEVKAHKPEILAYLSRQPQVYTEGESLADSLEACIALGKRLAAGEFAALRCGITGKRCTFCQGVPCLGSTPWD